ncbi:MAG: glycosyltransferase [Ilumatobacteraceae bacterium]
MAETKQSWKVADAAALLPEVQVAFVGEGSESMGSLAPNIVGTGRVDGDDYDRWLSRASLAIQLRATSNGESSGAVSDCLSMGVPLIVSDIGSFAELPSSAVLHVPVDIGASELAAEVRRLLNDHDRLLAMSDAALAYAHRNTYDAAASRLLSALRVATPRTTGTESEVESSFSNSR